MFRLKPGEHLPTRSPWLGGQPHVHRRPDRGMEAVLWVVLLACAGTIYLLDVGLLPDPTDVGAAAAFVVNLRLIAKPLSEIGKVYTKWREAWPAILPVYGR